MTILAFETSCDETSASIIENGVKISSLVTATSSQIHQKYGGIIPDKAARAQLESIIPVIHEALAESRQKPETIDALAVTIGPGLIGSLLIGVESAKALAFAWQKPLIPVNHLIGHIYANWIDTPKPPEFPALVLLVSGGHSELILMESHGKFRLLGATRDDAAGECFDKCGRLIGLPYPYGIFIQDKAKEFDSTNHTPFLPRPMQNQDNFDFSFSGLKTAVLNNLNNYSAEKLAYELQEAITDCLIEKTLKAIDRFHPRSVLLAGGVAANKRLREKITILLSSTKISLFIPEIRLCTDNAAIIGSAAYFNYLSIPLSKVSANPALTITS